MDADCLIKLTKANLKELVCDNITVVIPFAVKAEVVDDAGAHPEAEMILMNIKKRLLTVKGDQDSREKGEEAALQLFKQGGFDALCSDDRRFNRRLKIMNIPSITPAVFVAMLLKQRTLTMKEAMEKLDLLAPYISDDEYVTVNLVIKNWRTS
ncbi:MAG: hypothetical protein NT009_08565 [Proteobacteria bacterium]|nr:hypothetical protein [Pseudomonadota bacterium]